MNSILKKLTLGAIVCMLPLSAQAIDIDEDGKEEGVIFRPAFSAEDISSVWAITLSTNNYARTTQYQWGLSGDTPVAGNFSSTSGSDLAVFRNDFGIHYIREYDSTRTFANATAYQWGLNGDTPIGNCDVNNDGLDEIIVWRPSNGTWFTRLSAADSSTFSTAESFQWGLFGDTPIAVDYDMDNKCDYAIFRDGTFFITLSSEDRGEAAVIPWGSTGDIPVPGQWTSDTITDLAVFRPSSGSWIVRESNLAGLKSEVYSWGIAGDFAIPGDFDGDDKTDLAVYRPSNQTWFIRTSSSEFANTLVIQFGVNANDIPVSERTGAASSSS